MEYSFADLDKVRIRQYQALLEISVAIASNRDLTLLFHNLEQHLRTMVDFDRVSTLLYDPAQDVMRLHLIEPHYPTGSSVPPKCRLMTSPVAGSGRRRSR